MTYLNQQRQRQLLQKRQKNATIAYRIYIGYAIVAFALLPQNQ